MALNEWVKAKSGSSSASGSSSSGSGSDSESPAVEGARGSYGGKGEFHLPVDHKAGMAVHVGGAMCGNCKHLNGKDSCDNEQFQEWNGGDPKIPGDPLGYCSDWWEPADPPEASE